MAAGVGGVGGVLQAPLQGHIEVGNRAITAFYKRLRMLHQKHQYHLSVSPRTSNAEVFKPFANG